MALVQLKNLGGIFTIIGAYAPYEGIRAAGGRRSEQQRIDFFLSLGDLISESARAGPVITTGDLNTSVRWRRTGEEHYFGPAMHTPLTPAAATISAHAPEPLQSVATARNEASNRDLLAEL